MKNLLVKSTKRGRGVFAKLNFKKGEIIEASPVIVLENSDRNFLDKTNLYNYYFWWGKDKKKAAIGLGYSSLYNHSFTPNAEYLKDLQKNTIIFKALRKIKKGEEILVNYNGNPADKSPLWFKVI
jgi:SET domain-containing protein